MATKAAPKRETLVEGGVIALAFSPDRDAVAFSPNNHLIHIASIGTTDCATWTITHTLQGHEQSVSGIDWSPATNSICSCAHDRTAFVWTFDAEAKVWRQILVMVDATIKRGLTCIKWSPSGKKLFLSAASANIGVAKFDTEGQYWRCAVAEPHLSAVTCLAAHPTLDTVLLSGSTDCSAKIMSAYTKALDGAASAINAKIGTELHATRLRGWVNALAWSPSGVAFVIATHDSRITVVEAPSGETAISDAGCFSRWVARQVTFSSLPMRSCAFIDADSIVGAGHDCYPVVWGRVGATWALTRQAAVDKKEKKQLSVTEAAREKFQREAAQGQQADAVPALETRHKNTIVSVIPLAGGGSPFLFATGSLDGRVELWGEDALAPAK